MFQWYREAEKYYAYLSDVSLSAEDMHNLMELYWLSDLRNSRCFTHGWTLQELLAPRSIDFYSRQGKWLGDKNTLENEI